MSHGDVSLPVAGTTRLRLEALEGQVAARERELSTAKADLLDLQVRYFAEVGPLHAQLHDLEDALVEIEIRLGLRPPPAPDGDGDQAGEADRTGRASPSGCGHRAAPSADLKRMFRHVARTLHPDRARDDASRFRRHSLMAEANRAYAEQDEDRLRLILHAWERGPESGAAVGPDATPESAERRAADLEARLVAMDAEFDELRRSAIWKLRAKRDEARAQGWDLFAEIAAEVRREIGRARARLAALRRQEGSGARARS